MEARPRVTDRVKCYVFVCAGCGLLAQTERADTLTCSPACRVRAHRSGATDKLRRIARAQDIIAGSIARAQAIMLLRPDLFERASRGEIKIDDQDTQREMNKSFWALVKKQISELEAAA